MISTILGAFRVGEIRNKILFTAGILLTGKELSLAETWRALRQA